ncbi:MAG: acyl-CoA dehydrogenase family protein [bacterium]|nr:acyl-CoA dehydrogenase family protein [bacterium]
MFELSEGAKMIEQTLRQYMTNEVAPKVEAMEKGEISSFEVIKGLFQSLGITEMGRNQMLKLVEKKRKLEAAGDDKMNMKKELRAEGGMMGGAQADPIIMFVAIKEICRVSPSLALVLTGQLGLAANTIVGKGTSDQIEKYAVPLFSFEKMGAWGLTEPEAGSDAFALKTTAKPDGDYYILNGSKTFITNAPYADILVIWAHIDREKGTKADKRLIYPFVVEKGTPGLAVSKPMNKMGMKGSPTGEIFLDDVRIHKDQLLGKKEKTGREEAKESLSGEREGAPAMAWGIIERCFEDSLEYACTRKQFGKYLIEYQLMQEKIARMYMHLENVRNLAFKQAWAVKEGKSREEDFTIAKYYASSAACEVASEAVQLMGGYGYMQEYHVEMLYRDAKLIGIGGGTQEIQMLNCCKALVKERKGWRLSLAGGFLEPPQ